MILDQDSSHAPDTRRRGRGRAQKKLNRGFFCGERKGLGREGNGSGITNLRLDCTGVGGILSSIFFKVFFRTAHHQNQTEVVGGV